MTNSAYSNRIKPNIHLHDLPKALKISVNTQNTSPPPKKLSNLRPKRPTQQWISVSLILWHSSHYWPFVKEIHWSPVDCTHIELVINGTKRFFPHLQVFLFTVLISGLVSCTEDIPTEVEPEAKPLESRAVCTLCAINDAVMCSDAHCTGCSAPSYCTAKWVILVEDKDKQLLWFILCGV